MKSIVLVAITCGLYLVVITILFRVVHTRQLAKLMLRVFLLSLPFFIATHWLTPPDLGFLPPFLTESSRWIDLGFGVFVYGAAFFGGLLQLFNLADRGFSLRMLIDIDEAPGQGMTLPEVMRGYSHGRGIEWMYQKRLKDLFRLNLLEEKEAEVVLTPAGLRMASTFEWLRNFLRFKLD